MDRVPLWKPLLILLVVGLCLLCIYPPERKLKPGLDLSGGTTLVYQALVKEGAAETEIDDTIAVLQNRVDPNGVRNLIWRRQAGRRIEIQMAHASPEVAKRRKEYQSAREALLKSNIQARDIDAALAAPADSRAKVLATIAGSDTLRLKRLQDLAVAFDQMQVAQKPYLAAQDALDKLTPPAADATAFDKTAFETKTKALRAQVTQTAQDYRKVRDVYNTQRDAILADNLTALEIDAWLEASDKPLNTKAGPQPSARAAVEEKLLASHPTMATQIKALGESYKKYETVKGPLDDPADLITLLKGSGVLEFRIAAGRNLPELTEYITQLNERGPRAGQDKPWRWLEVNPAGFAKTPEERQELAQNATGFFMMRSGLVVMPYAGRYYALMANTKGSSLTEKDPGWRLTHGGIGRDEKGFRAIEFQLNTLGADLMGAMTGAHRGEQMAIILDGKVASNATIQSQIHGSGIISSGNGGYSATDADFIVRTLKAGALKAQLSEEPISVKTTGPQFGQDNLRSGLMAVVGAFLVTAGFMAIYYFFNGMIANVALILNVLIVLGAMALFEATFTLGGIAGLVLTIGMAVDTNVLVFERLREELERGNPVKTAVRLGYQKAFSSIFDSHVTTLCTSIILYYTGSADIRGFAVTLGIGIVANLFTGLFVSRVITELVVQYLKPKTFKMLPMVLPALKATMRLNVDWLAKRNIFWACSGVLIAIGAFGLYSRGADLFDIEFRGGTQVQMQLGDSPDGKPHRLTIDEVRKRLIEAAKKNDLPLLEDATPVTIGDTVEGKASAFTISTLETNAAKVSDAITNAFADVLPSGKPYEFKGMGIATLTDPATPAPVYPITKASVGENVGQPEVKDNVSGFLGGVAIVLADVKPATTAQEIKNRIDQIRTLPMKESLGSRQYEVFGTQRAPVQGATGDTLYTGFIVVARDETTNYSNDPTSFTATGGLAETEWNVTVEAMRRSTSLASVSNFSPQVSGTMQQQAIVACLLSCLLIVAYLWFTFGDLRYGLAAIVATIHDVLIALAFLGLSGFFYQWGASALGVAPFRIDLTQIAALLTLIGYTINDKIVVFDRIRENRGKLAYASREMINASINQTLSRTFLTGGTVILSVAVLYIVGGVGVHGFAYTMFFGTISGIYSTIAVACPLLLVAANSPATTKPEESAPPAKTA
jgi:SecD/SecF fusion protein